MAELTDGELLSKINAQIVALVDGTDVESYTVGEETMRGVRLSDLTRQRDELIARGVVPGAASTTTTPATSSFHLGVFDGEI